MKCTKILGPDLSLVYFHLFTEALHQLLPRGLPAPPEALLEDAPQHGGVLAQDGTACLHLQHCSQYIAPSENNEVFLYKRNLNLTSREIIMNN